MSYASETGYVPMSFDEIMDYLRQGVNTVLESEVYDADSFVGTNFYKFFYPLAQRVQEGEIKASEIFAKVQDYFNAFDQTILQPKITPNGLIAILHDLGYESTLLPISEFNEEAVAGRVSLCVNLDTDVKGTAVIQDLTFTSKNADPRAMLVNISYEDGMSISVDVTSGSDIVVTIVDGVSTAANIRTAIVSNPEASFLVDVEVTGTGTNPQSVTDSPVFLEIDDNNLEEQIIEVCDVIKDYTAAGTTTNHAPVRRPRVLSNGQEFLFGFFLPFRYRTFLKLTITPSRNNNAKRDTPEQIKDKLLNNIYASYRMGMDFEPERYFTVVDAPWAADIKLEYAVQVDDTEPSFNDGVYPSDYRAFLQFALEDIEVIEE